MLITVAIFFLALGATIGSFLNVVVWRANENKGPWHGRSECPQCRAKLSFFELVPIVSFLALRRRCRHCLKPISWFYLHGEVLNALVWALTGTGLFLADQNILMIALGLALATVLVLLWLFDLKDQILPDRYVAIAIFLSVAWTYGFGTIGDSFFIPAANWLTLNQDLMVVAFGAGGVGALFLLLLWVITGGRGMGLGDVKLMVALGILSAGAAVLDTLLLAFVGGAIFGIISISRGTKNLKSRLAFGPFLIGAQFVIWWWHLYA